MPASALFRVAARPSLDTGGGSIYVNLLSGLPDAHLVCDTHPMSTPSAKRYKHHRFPVEIFRHGVWLYCRFSLSYRDVEELPFARGIIVTYEAIRQWCWKFGQSYANQLRRRRPQPGDTWHLDEVFLAIDGERHYLWRAVNQDGNVLDILVQRRRERRLQGFKSPGHAQRFLSAYGPIAQHFRPRRHRVSASAYWQEMRRRFDTWQGLTNLPTTA
jgi:transposase-like protein